MRTLMQEIDAYNQEFKNKTAKWNSLLSHLRYTRERTLVHPVTSDTVVWNHLYRKYYNRIDAAEAELKASTKQLKDLQARARRLYKPI